jgi:lysyl-tRNA synthetase class II
MLDSTNMPLDSDLSYKAIANSCSRGNIIGIEGYPGRTTAGEFTIIAKSMSLLGSCDKNLPMMNWTHT